MRIQVAAEMKMPGTPGRFHGEYPYENMEFGGRTVSFAEPLTVDGTFVYDGGGFNVTGTLHTVLNSECAKCTKEFREPFGFDFEERFEKNGSADDGIYTFRGDALELADMIRDNIYLHLPMVSVCSADCKGLCPVCGCDRNTTQCGCVREEAEESNGSLAALGALLNQSKEV